MDSSRLPARRSSAAAAPPRTPRSLWAVIATVLALVVAGLSAPAAFAASNVTSATFSSDPGHVSASGMLFVKTGATVTLTLATSPDTVCVEVRGAFSATQTSTAGKSLWTVTTTATGSDGLRGVTAGASDKIVTNNNGTNCGGQGQTVPASYTIDNTAPVLSATVAPTPNAAGWNNTSATVNWTATDAGAGVKSGPSPATDEVTTDGTITRTSSATDQLGNVGNGEVTVRVDKTVPTITASQVKNADGTTTITFTCSDATSGIATTQGCIADGSTTNAKTVGPNTTVNGTAKDAAGNTATASSTSPAGDTTGPVLTGLPTTQPNGAGWYKGDVVIDWTASDAESGIPAQPADTTITGEGTALTSTQSATNGVGLTTTATSPAVNIDRTAPTTGISGASNSWVNAVVLTPGDNLSGVARTEYTVDGGAVQQGTTFSLSTEGAHTITYRSVDAAGNEEGFHTATVNIDMTAPTIGHGFDPDTYTGAGWINTTVIVSFTCEDQGGSGIAGCTDDVIVADEGEQSVVGTATDNAGNASNDTATVRVDKTAPTITATVGGTKNDAGWYNEDVTVSFSAEDALSGIASLSPAAVLSDGAGQTASGTATDAAGNSASTTVTGINVDTTAPVLTAEYSTAWSAGDVAVVWTCTDDGGSGVADAPGTRVVDGEGANLSDTASCTDVAGNTTVEMVTGIRIDRTAPVTTASVADAGDDGWHSAAVEVTLTGKDNLSGVASTFYTVDGGATQEYAGPFSITADGEHTVTFWSKDNAGNVEQAGPSIEVKVDTTAPATEVIDPISPASGWFVTSGIPFAFDASDEHSGVAATYYTIDGGSAQTYGEPFEENLSTGEHKITYWSVDIAGNTEAVHELTINLDLVAPTIDAKRSPEANDAGWNNTDVTVTFTATDTGSGVDEDTLTKPVTVTEETAEQVISGSVRDVAGNQANASITVRVDKTDPTISADEPAGTLGSNGWYTSDVTVGFTCADALSGMKTCPGPVVLTSDGQTASGRAIDKAGNTADAILSGVHIDKVGPKVTSVNVDSKEFTLGAVPTPTCIATDDGGSGVASCTVAVSGGNASGVGTFTYQATATDVAGNTSTAKGSFTVIYRFDGFLQPINDTAHQIGVSTSIFKAGSTVPVKFQLKDANGKVVQPAAAPTWITPVKGSSTSAAVDESIYTVPADSGNVFRYDATAQQYIYNWKTGNSGGNYWRIGVKFDDGKTYYVNIGLR